MEILRAQIEEFLSIPSGSGSGSGYGDGSGDGYGDGSDFGKTVFLTREEAKAALGGAGA